MKLFKDSRVGLMPWWKSAAMRCYYFGTLPYRRFLGQRLAKAGRAPVMVLFYHRVADRPPSALTCPCGVFAEHVRWLKKHFEMVSLAEAQQRMRSGYNDRPCVSITFDDGYAENCDFAIPLLVGEGIPCTYFVTTKYVFEGRPFPHDLAQGLRFMPNTVEQLRDMADQGIEIGAHTRTHPDVGAMTDPAQVYDEIVGSKQDLENILDRPVRYFAFPYGLHANLSQLGFQIARDAGCQAVCSAYGGYNFPGDDPFHLQRIHGCPQIIRIQNWLSLDPRKLNISRYEFQAADVEEPADCSA